MKRTPTQIPSGGMGNGLERANSKNNFIYYQLKYYKTEISETYWSLYRLKPRSYNYTKYFKSFVKKGRPLGGFERSKSHFGQ